MCNYTTRVKIYVKTKILLLFIILNSFNHYNISIVLTIIKSHFFIVQNIIDQIYKLMH